MSLRRKHYENGQGVVEYALIAAGVAVVTMLILSMMGVSVRDVFCEVNSTFGGEGCGCTMGFDDSSDLDGWTGADVGKTLGVQNGQLCNTNSRHSFFSACNSGDAQSDFTANLSGIDINPKGNNSHPGFDFLFRTDGNTSNGYWMSYSAKANRITFWKGVNGKRVFMTTQRVPADWVNGGLDLQLKAEGDTFTVYQDGEQIMQASDSTYTEGKFAWRNKPGSSTCIDEMSISQ
jgi:Flp pilus assembly pilin Flp